MNVNRERVRALKYVKGAANKKGINFSPVLRTRRNRPEMKRRKRSGVTERHLRGSWREDYAIRSQRRKELQLARTEVTQPAREDRYSVGDS